jgi:sulfate-transporting ATPase
MPEGEAVHRGSPGTLDVRDLTVRFGGVLALSDVSLSVEPGEVVGLIGPNGAGKTTLIDAVTGFARGYRGRVTLNGTVLDRWSARRRARAGLGRSFQSLELFEDVTVRENLQTASDPRDLLGYLVALVWPRRTHLGAAALAAARTFELGGDLDRCPCDLSFGKRRLVAIARAIAAEPSVLLLDEPAAGLDDHERAELGDLIRRLAREWGIAILLVEHDVSMVFSICDRVVVIDFGTKIAEGTPAEIRDDDRVVTAYLGAGDEAHVARAEPMALDANPG